MAKQEHGAPRSLEVAGREVRVSSPLRPYFPQEGLTKWDVVSYYAALAGPLLRALWLRPTTLERWPKGVLPEATMSQRDGTRGDAFYQKRIPKGAPDYVETARIAFPSGRTADEVCPTEEAVAVWAANLGTITFHPWPVRRPDVDHPDELRLDFDPQPGAGFAQAVEVALAAREVLHDLGWTGYPKTSGGRGVHVYVRIRPAWDFTDMRHAAIAIGREVQRRCPELVTMQWWREERPDGTVFIDFNQNSRDRTIASAWSVRARPGAKVSTPLTWEQLPQVKPEEFTVRTVPDWFAEQGDAHAQIDSEHFDLSPALGWYQRDEDEHGLGEMPYPPDYPKVAGEPKRVQPSRARQDD